MESAVDANGLRILAQEIHECETAIARAKQDLCRVSAERIRLQREGDALESAIERKTRQAAMALDRGEEGLAREAAQWIADNEPLLADQREKQQRLEARVGRLKQGLQTVTRDVQAYRRELRMVQATASVQSASEKLSRRSDTIDVRLGGMQTSLQRIKARQQAFADRMAAAESIENDLSDRQLDRRLAALESGTPPGSAEAVLERIRKRQDEDLSG